MSAYDFWFSSDINDWISNRKRQQYRTQEIRRKDPPYNYKDLGKILGVHVTRVGQLIRQHSIKPKYNGARKFDNETLDQLKKILDEARGNI